MQRVFWFGILKPLDLEGQVSTRPLQRQHALYTLRTSVFTPAFHININLRNGQNATPKISYIQGSMILVNLNPHQKWFQNHVSKFNCLLCNGKFTIKKSNIFITVRMFFTKAHLLRPESRKPLAKGFLSIFRRVICRAEKKITSSLIINDKEGY